MSDVGRLPEAAAKLDDGAAWDMDEAQGDISPEDREFLFRRADERRATAALLRAVDDYRRGRAGFIKVSDASKALAAAVLGGDY